MKPADLNMKPEKLRQLAYDRTVNRLERQFQGLSVEPTASQVFRQHLDDLIPTDDVVEVDESSVAYKEKVQRIMKENSKKFSNMSGESGA